MLRLDIPTAPPSTTLAGDDAGKGVPDGIRDQAAGRIGGSRRSDAVVCSLVTKPARGGKNPAEPWGFESHLVAKIVRFQLEIAGAKPVLSPL